MKIAAITMVYRDYWALSQWYAHYARQIGADNLFIVAHGQDDRIKDICPRAEVITIARNDLTGFDKRRNAMLNAMQDELCSFYDWVIRTDADELICLDPTLAGSFQELLSDRPSDAVFSLGMNIAERADDAPLIEDASVFGHRTQALLSGHYSKAWAVRNGCGLGLHGALVAPDRAESFVYDLPKGVYLAHLKYANVEALAEANAHRREVARSKATDLPGTAWRKADRIAEQFFTKVETYPELDWNAAEADAYALQSVDPKRDTRTGLVRGRFNSFKFKTTLPDWFGHTD